MAINRRTRGAQYPLTQEYVFNYNDGAAYLSALNGASVELNPKANVTDFGSGVQPTGLLSGVTYVANTGGQTYYFEIMSLPTGSQIMGGEVQIEAPYVGPATATLSVGDINTGTLYASAVNLKATAWTNAPTGITNSGVVQTMTNSTANGITAVGQLVTISGCTGASAAYNGTFLVDSFTATSVVVTNPALSSSLTLAGTPAGTFITGRTALAIPAQQTSVGLGYDAYSGADIRMTLALGSGAATQGRVRVRVMYTLDGRVNEISPT